MHENEANKQYFAIIRWLAHSMMETVKIGQNWLSNGLLRQFFSEIWETDTIFEISASTCIRKNAGSEIRQKFKKGSPYCRVEYELYSLKSSDKTFIGDAAAVYDLCRLHEVASWHIPPSIGWRWSAFIDKNEW